jgi:hypothetical protein
MASCKTINTSSSIHKITIRNRKISGSREHEMNLASTASGSPSSPRRIRILDGKQALGNTDKRAPSTESACSSNAVIAREEVWLRPSLRLMKLVDSVTRNLWNRDGVNEGHPEPLSNAIKTAHWYVNRYVSSLSSCEVIDGKETAVALAAVFITFKAADFIPGIGRVKMHQLLKAYERVPPHIILTERDNARLIDDICKTEMDIMCIADFNFSPIQ